MVLIWLLNWSIAFLLLYMTRRIVCLQQEDIRNYIDNSLKHGAHLSAFRKERVGGDSHGISYWYSKFSPQILKWQYLSIRHREDLWVIGCVWFCIEFYCWFSKPYTGHLWLLCYRYEDDSLVGHRLYREIRKFELKRAKLKGSNVPLTATYEWETVATNFDEFEDVSVSF